MASQLRWTPETRLFACVHRVSWWKLSPLLPFPWGSQHGTRQPSRTLEALVLVERKQTLLTNGKMDERNHWPLTWGGTWLALDRWVAGDWGGIPRAQDGLMPRSSPSFVWKEPFTLMSVPHFSMAISYPAVALDMHLGFRKSSFSSFLATLEQESTCLEDAGIVCSTILGLPRIPDLPHVVRIINVWPNWGVWWGWNLTRPQRSRGLLGTFRGLVVSGDVQCQVPFFVACSS